MKRKVRRPRPAYEPGAAIELEMLAVPKEGSVTVRFLGEARSILTHRIKDESFACPGEEHCPTANHRARTTWKAYAPVEAWRPAPHDDWMPAVLEITERLWGKLRGRPIKGEVWKLFRQTGRHGYREVCGSPQGLVLPERLRTDVTVEEVVKRVYRTTLIAWDVEEYLPAPPILEPSKDQPPQTDRVKNPKPRPKDESMSNREFVERLKNDVGRPVEAEPARNGTH